MSNDPVWNDVRFFNTRLQNTYVKGLTKANVMKIMPVLNFTLD